VGDKEINEFWEQSMQDVTGCLGYLEPIYSRLGHISDQLDKITEHLKNIEVK